MKKKEMFNPVPVKSSTELAEEHWLYVRNTLIHHGTSEVELTLLKHHYVTAFIHGYKHGCNDCRL